MKNLKIQVVGSMDLQSVDYVRNIVEETNDYDDINHRFINAINYLYDNKICTRGKFGKQYDENFINEVVRTGNSLLTPMLPSVPTDKIIEYVKNFQFEDRKINNYMVERWFKLVQKDELDSLPCIVLLKN